jgi:hypothetical protein
MTWTSQTECRAHDQDNPAFCGEATEMMICAHQGVAFSNLDQTQLAQLAGPNPSNPNSTDPQKLRDILQQFIATQNFDARMTPQKKEAVRQIISALLTSRVPVAVPRYPFQHWTVVAAIQTDVQPATGAHYNVQLVYYNSPVPINSPPPPHSDADRCASQILNGIKARTVDRYESWIAHFFADASQQFINVSDSPANPTIELPNDPVPLPPRPITPAAMVEEGRGALATIELRDGSSALATMADIQPGTAIFVHRLDQDRGDYYLLPWSLHGKLLVTTKIDTDSGRFASAHFHNGGWYNHFGVPPSAVAALARRGVDVKHLPADKLSYVWQPCLESSSPHFPFLEFGAIAPVTPADASSDVKVGAEPLAPTEVFVRLDGNIFDRLTTE